MYVIAVYDVSSERTSKMLKLCRRYLHWIQNSVFEGELSALQLKELIQEAEQIMEKDYDSFILFTNKNAQWLNKQVVGCERSSANQFL